MCPINILLRFYNAIGIFLFSSQNASILNSAVRSGDLKIFENWETCLFEAEVAVCLRLKWHMVCSTPCRRFPAPLRDSTHFLSPHEVSRVRLSAQNSLDSALSLLLIAFLSVCVSHMTGLHLLQKGKEAPE